MVEILELDARKTWGPFEAGAISRFYTQPPHQLQQKLTQVIARSEDLARLDSQRLRERLKYWSAIDVVVASGG